MERFFRWAGAVLGAVLTACAVVFGTSAARQGERSASGLIVMLSVFLGIVGLLVFMSGLVVSPGRPLARRITGAVVLVVALPLAWLGSGPVFALLPPRPLWTAPADRPQSARAVAVWQDGGLLVRARQDRIDAWRAADGTLAWSLAARPREQLCAVGRSPVDGVVAVAYGRYQAPCEQLTAVRLSTGQELWRRTVPAADALATTGTVVVASAPGALSAFALADGKDAWTAPATGGCAYRTLAGSAVRALAVEYCPQAGDDAAGRTWLRALGPDGRPGWRTDLGAESRPEQLEALAADPPVVRLKEADPRGVDAVLSLDAAGALRAALPLAVPDLELKGLEGEPSFALAPARHAAVVGDLLVTTAAPAGSSFTSRVVAFSLADGGRKWTRTIDSTDDVESLTGSGGRLLALVETGTVRSRGHTLLELDPATGRSRHEREADEARLDSDSVLAVAGDRFLVVHENGTGSDRPVLAFPFPR